MNRTSLFIGLGLACAATVLHSCGGRSVPSSWAVNDTLTNRAGLLTLVDHGSWTQAVVDDPWNPGKNLATYALVREKSVKDSIPEDFVVIDVPLRSSLAFAGVYGNAAIELGAASALTGIADAQYATADLKKLLDAGKVSDVGPALGPSIEAIAKLRPQAILRSPYHNAGNGPEERLGIPVVEMADYMETDPLGRAEWLLLLGELYGRRDRAREIYAHVADEYAALADSVRGLETPTVMTEKAFSGVWNVPGGSSYAARLIRDAGGRLPWQDDGATGSHVWDGEQVLARASDADIWLMRLFGPFTLEDLAAEMPLYTHFKPYKTGEVYISDTSKSPIFDDAAFHPEKVLREYVNIFHPGVLGDGRLRYFHRAR